MRDSMFSLSRIMQSVRRPQSYATKWLRTRSSSKESSFESVGCIVDLMEEMEAQAVDEERSCRSIVDLWEEAEVEMQGRGQVCDDSTAIGDSTTMQSESEDPEVMYFNHELDYLEEVEQDAQEDFVESGNILRERQTSTPTLQEPSEWAE